MFKKVALVLLAIILLEGVAIAQPEETGQIFSLSDPKGDSFGPGSYTYPGDQSFPKELPDMLDLVEFRVINKDETTRFEFHFAQPPNLAQPWGGEGYNFHRIDLYIASGGKGCKATFAPGAQVQFKEPWQINLRIRDWQGAYLRQWQDDPSDTQAGIWQGDTEEFQVFVEGRSIVAELGHNILESAAADWQYYILIGLQDAYGPDHYRKITAEGGPWTGGGGSETEFSPNVYDILTAAAADQERQLDWSPGRLAKLEPVGNRSDNPVMRALLVAATVMVAAGVAALIWLYRKK